MIMKSIKMNMHIKQVQNQKIQNGIMEKEMNKMNM